MQYAIQISQIDIRHAPPRRPDLYLHRQFHRERHRRFHVSLDDSAHVARIVAVYLVDQLVVQLQHEISSPRWRSALVTCRPVLFDPGT